MDKNDLKVLIAAINDEESETILRLLRQYPEQARAYTFFAGATWLGYAAGKGKLRSVEALVAAGADVNQGSEKGNVAPICNAAQGHRAVVEFLLDRGARLDVSTSLSNPLIWAVTHWQQADDSEIVKLLLRAGIDSLVKYPFEGRTKTKKPLDATAKALLWGTPVKAGVIAAWNGGGREVDIRSLLEAAMEAADSHLERYKYGDKKIAEMQQKHQLSLEKAISSALATQF